MKTIVRNIVAVMMGVMMITFSSCEHKDLCYHHPHGVKLKVEYDWKNAPDAFAKGMCIYFYAVDGSSYRRFDFSNNTGGYIELYEGEYNVITYNNDTEGVKFDSPNAYYPHRLYTREGNVLEGINGSAATSAPRAKGSEDERVVITPDKMWGCAVTRVKVARTGTYYEHETITGDMDAPQLKVDSESEDVVLTFYPEDLMCEYTYEIINATNLDQADQMCATLSGMSGGLTLSTGELDIECVTLPLEAKFDLETSRVIGGFYTFGHHEDNVQEHRMILYVWMKNGDKYYYGGEVPEDKRGEDFDDKFNVTEQIHNAPDKRHVHIIIDGLDLPKPITSGYTPTVDDWMDEFIDIPM